MTLNEDDVADALAIEYVNRKNSAKTKEAIARVTFRILTGLIPFPSQVEEVAKQLEVRGEKAERELKAKIEAAIRKGVGG